MSICLQLRYIFVLLVSTMIDLDQVDPDWELAKLHSKTTAVGKPKGDQICPCCFNVVEKQEIPICIHANQLHYLGFGFPLYFIFIKYCMFLLALHIATYSAFSLFWAVQHSNLFCLNQKTTLLSIKPTHFLALNRTHDHQIEDSKTTKLSQEQSQDRHLECLKFFIRVSRVEKDLTNEEISLRTISFITTAAILLLNKDNLRKTYRYFDEKHTTYADYSIMLTAQHKIANFRKATEDILKSNAFNSSHQAEDIILLPRIPKLESIKAQRLRIMTIKGKLIQKQKRIRHKNENDGGEEDEQLEKLVEQLLKIEKESEDNLQELMEAAREYDETVKDDSIRCRKAILVFDTEQQKRTVLKQFPLIIQRIADHYYGEGNRVRMTDAPEPTQILWEQIDHSPTHRNVSIIFGFALAVGVIMVETTVFYFIISAKSRKVEQVLELSRSGDSAIWERIQAHTMAISAIVLVILFNKLVMGWLMHKITRTQLHETTTTLQFSFSVKYTLAMFFTTALMTLFVEAIEFDNYYKADYGVIEQQSIMFFMTSFLVPLIWLINPFDIFVKLRRKYYHGKASITQGKANQIMQDFHYDIGKRYAEVLKVMWFTFLYSSIIPLGSILSLIGLALYYWVDRYNLLRRSSVKSSVSGKMSRLGSKMLDFCLFLRALGQLWFDVQLRNSFSYLTVAELLVGIVFLLIPWNDIFEHMEGDIYSLAQARYSINRPVGLQLDYRSTNPINKILRNTTWEKMEHLRARAFTRIKPADRLLIRKRKQSMSKALQVMADTFNKVKFQI